MTLRALVSAVTALALAGAARVDDEEEELATDRESLHPLNRSLAQALAESQEALDPVSATITAVSLAFDIYEGYDKTKDAIASYNARKAAVDNITKGHTKDVEIVVRAAHTELGKLEGGKKELDNVLGGDAFIDFKGLLSTFEMAQKMCVGENEFFSDPLAWTVRAVGNMFGKEQAPEEVTRLEIARQLIDDIVKSLHGVMDQGVCPQLKRIVRQDLLKAQQHVEVWEKAVNQMMKPMSISFYKMMYDRYTTEGNSAVSNTFSYVSTTVMDKAHKLTSHVEQHDLETCFNTANGQGMDHKGKGELGVDKYELEIDVSHTDPIVLGKLLKSTSSQINMALDQASMNMEMYDRECRRVAPNGREHIIEELQEEKKLQGEKGQDAEKMFKAATCDFCLRYGCREMGVLSTVEDVYGIVGYGIDKVVLHLAKTFGPPWFTKILNTVSAIEDVVSPSGDKAVEFYCSLVFLLGKGAEQMKVGETCLQLGEVLEKKKMEKSKADGTLKKEGPAD